MNDSRADLLLKITSDIADLKKTQQEVGKLSGSLGDLAKMGAAAGAAFGAVNLGLTSALSGIKSFLEHGVKFNAMLEQQAVSFKTLLGSADAAGQRMRDLAKFAAGTPFELPEIVKASKLLQAFTGNALATGDGLRLVGDAASAVGAPIDAVAIWMGRLYAALRSGQPMGEAIQNLTQLGLISVEAREQLNRLSGKALSTGDVMKAMGKAFGQYAGAMEEQSTTFSGELSTLRDNLNAFSAELNVPIFEALRSGMHATNADMGSFKEQVLGTAEAIKDLVKWTVIAAGVSAAGSGAVVAFQGGGMLLGSMWAAQFSTAIASAPVWAVAGGLLAIAAAAAIAIAVHANGAISALNTETSTQVGEDDMQRRLRQKLNSARTPEEISKIGASASMLSDKYRKDAANASNDGGWLGQDGEKDRLNGLAEGYARLAVMAKNGSDKLLAAGAIRDKQLAAEAANVKKIEEDKKAMSEALKLTDAMGKDVGKAQEEIDASKYELANEQGKLAILDERKAKALSLYETQLAAANLTKDDIAANNAQIILSKNLLNIEADRAKILNKIAETDLEDALAAQKRAQANITKSRDDELSVALAASHQKLAEIDADRFKTNAEKAPLRIAELQKDNTEIEERIKLLREEDRITPNPVNRDKIDSLRKQQAGNNVNIGSTQPLGVGESIAAASNNYIDRIGTVADQVGRAWSSMGQSMSSSLGNAFSDMILKAESFKDAMAGFGNAIVQSMVQVCANMLAEWIISHTVMAAVRRIFHLHNTTTTAAAEGAQTGIVVGAQATQTAAVIAGSGAQTAASVAAAGTTGSAWGFAAIMSSIGQLGPIVGPLVLVGALAGLTLLIANMAKHADGGLITGAGTGTSDSIPAWLSNGEYVMPAAETHKYRPLLNAMRAGTLSQEALASSPILTTAGGQSRSNAEGVGANINLHVHSNQHEATLAAMRSPEGESHVIDIVQRNIHSINGRG